MKQNILLLQIGFQTVFEAQTVNGPNTTSKPRLRPQSKQTNDYKAWKDIMVFWPWSRFFHLYHEGQYLNLERNERARKNTDLLVSGLSNFTTIGSNLIGSKPM